MFTLRRPNHGVPLELSSPLSVDFHLHTKCRLTSKFDPRRTGGGFSLIVPRRGEFGFLPGPVPFSGFGSPSELEPFRSLTGTVLNVEALKFFDIGSSASSGTGTGFDGFRGLRAASCPGAPAGLVGNVAFDVDVSPEADDFTTPRTAPAIFGKSRQLTRDVTCGRISTFAN